MDSRCSMPLAMTNDNLLPFSFPATRGKKVAAGFDGHAPMAS
jgi:hypothetical protein